MTCITIYYPKASNSQQRKLVQPTQSLPLIYNVWSRRMINFFIGNPFAYQFPVWDWFIFFRNWFWIISHNSIFALHIGICFAYILALPSGGPLIIYRLHCCSGGRVSRMCKLISDDILEYASGFVVTHRTNKIPSVFIINPARVCTFCLCALHRLINGHQGRVIWFDDSLWDKIATDAFHTFPFYRRYILRENIVAKYTDRVANNCIEWTSEPIKRTIHVADAEHSIL